jgi:predicted RNase H-like HicB family nuclease
MRLTAVVTQDDDWFMARCLEVAVVSQGPTIDEALANLTDSSPAVGVPGARMQR